MAHEAHHAHGDSGGFSQHSKRGFTLFHDSDEKIQTLDVALRWSGPLKKTTPLASSRYQNSKRVDTFPISFEPKQAFDKRPACLELADWTPLIHPEGSVYYYNATYHVVTEANLRTPHGVSNITFWMAEFETALAHAAVKLPDTYELFLEPEEDQCGYYLVDHGCQTIFWLDTANTEDLDLPDVSSEQHLQLKLQGLYWVHMEYFPMHGTLPASAEATLVGILTHAWGDQATSSLSTAPYSAEQCKNFLAMLDRLIGLPHQDGYKTCVIARVMNECLHSRFINLYGNPESARLARNQSTMPSSDVRESRLLRMLCSTFMFQYRKEMKDLRELWVDNIVYTEHWRAFLKSRLQEWKSLTLLSVMLTLIDTLLIINYHANSSTLLSNLPVVRTGSTSATISLLLSLSTTIVGVTTILIHQPYAKSHAAEANVYLDRASHETLGLQPLAIVLGLPRSLFLWALVTGGIALLSFSFQILDSWSAIFFGTFAVALFALLVWVTRFFHVRETEQDKDLGNLAAPFEGFASGFFGNKNTLDKESV